MSKMKLKVGDKVWFFDGTTLYEGEILDFAVLKTGDYYIVQHKDIMDNPTKSDVSARDVFKRPEEKRDVINRLRDMAFGSISYLHMLAAE